MTIRHLVPSLLASLLLAPAAHAGVASEGGARLYMPAGYVGAESGARAEALPRGVAGSLPESDGDAFHLAVDTGLYSGRDARSVQAALTDILPAVGWRGEVGDLAIEDATSLNTVSEEEARLQRDIDTRDIEERLVRRFGELSDVTTRALELQADENMDLLLQQRGAVRVRQLAGGLPIRGLGLRILLDGDGYIIGISGALTDSSTLGGRVVYGAERAEVIAESAIGEGERVADVSAAEGLAIATGSELRPAWRVEVTTTVDRTYAVFVDAETGAVLGVESLTWYATTAQGRAFTPDPDGTASTLGFEVNPAVGGDFTLTLDDVTTVTSGGADGCMTAVTVPDANNGLANFAVAPFTGTQVEDANAATYNCTFQEVNAFAKVYDLTEWFGGLGAETLPHIPVEVDLTTACGDGPNQACAGGGKLTFGLGTAVWGSPGIGDLWNSALDESVVAHELGHFVTWYQVNVGGGTLNSSMNEGMSDYWAMAYGDTDTFGAYWGQTTGMNVQSGFVPRQAESRDVFPEHMASNNEAHANGQMIAWAQYGFRQEMADRSALGAGLASRIAITGLTGTGFGVTNNLGTEKEVYGAFQSMLGAQLVDVGLVQARVDLVQAFARAGVFATAHEAVIDISDDYLSPTDAPPTFTVWPGQDFTFDATGDASDSSGYNQNYEVELANDPDFTVNVVKSGTKNNITESVITGNTFGTWTPSAAQWDTLTKGSTLYYRVRTWTANGTRQRDSEHTLAGLMEVPTAAAVINGGGSAGCSTTGRGALGGLGIALGAAALLRRRRSEG